MRIAIVLGAAILSHFVLDVIVHVAELPLLGPNSYLMGLGLWNWMALALTLELSLVAIGLFLYLRGKPTRRVGVVILMVVFSILTVVGMTASTAPNLDGVAVSWLMAPPLFGGLGWWLDRTNG